MEITGKSAVINWIWTGGTVGLNADYRSVGFNDTTDMADTTAGNDTHKTQIATIKSSSIDYSGVFPSGTAGTALIGALAVGNSGTLQIYPEGTAATNLLRSYPSIVQSLKQTTPYKDVVEISATFTSNGAWS